MTITEHLHPISRARYSYKSILTCLYNDEKNPKDYLRKILPASAPSQPPRGAEFMESRVSAVSHPHQSTHMSSNALLLQFLNIWGKASFASL